MTLAADEFIRRFLLHVLPKGFHRIITTGCWPAPAAKPTSRAQEAGSAAPITQVEFSGSTTTQPIRIATTDHRPPCPCCGGRAGCIEVFSRGGTPARPAIGRRWDQDLDPDDCPPRLLRCNPFAVNLSFPPPHPVSSQRLQAPAEHHRSGLNQVAECRQQRSDPRSPPASSSRRSSENYRSAELRCASNPHSRPTARRSPAGSFIGGFRTPAPYTGPIARAGPASETLPESGPPP